MRLLISLNICNLNAVDIFVCTISIKKIIKNHLKNIFFKENFFYFPVPTDFLSIMLIIWQQHLKSQHIFKQCCVEPLVWPKISATFKISQHSFSFLFFFNLQSSLSLAGFFLHGKPHLASDWLISVIAPNRNAREKNIPLFLYGREANSTKYGVAYGLRPLGRLSPLTVRCVFFMSLWAVFFILLC